MPRPHPLERWAARLLPPAAAVLSALWLVGQLARERWWLTGVAFFIPTIGAAAAAIVGGVIARSLGRRRFGGALLALAMAQVAFLLVVENRLFTPPPGRPARPASAAVPRTSAGEAPAPRRYRVVHWNTQDGRHGRRELGRRLTAEGADLYAVSEAPKVFPPGQRETWPAHDFWFQRGNLAILGRGAFEDRRFVHAEPRTRALTGRWRTPAGDELVVALVDLPSSILLARRPMLEWTVDLVTSIDADLMLGDLNTPRRAMTFGTLPAGYAHAYDLAGRGWSASWPAHLPLWSIDQSILGPRVTAHSYALFTHPESDHRLQRIELEVP